MGRLSVVLAALAIMVLGFVATLTMLADEERARSLLAAHAERQLGRQLQIDGSITIRYFPRLRIEAHDIRLSGSDVFSGPDLLAAEQLSLEVRLLPLLAGRVEASEFSVSQARLNLLMDEDGRHSFAGLLHHQHRPERRGILADGPLRLEDIELNFGIWGVERLRRVTVERIELDGLGFDRALGLHFQGQIGLPPVLEEVDLRGVLFMPAARGHFHVADLVLQGRMAGASLPLELTGQLAASAHLPTQITLEDGKLSFGQQEMLLEGAYAGRERPHFQVDVGAQELDAAEFLAMTGVQDLAEWLSSWALITAVHDYDVGLELGRLQLDQLLFSDLLVQLVGVDGLSSIERGQATMPGALVEFDGHLQVEAERSGLSLQAQFDIDDLAALVGMLDLPLSASGAGQLLMGTADDEDFPVLGRGSIRLFDGSLGLLGGLRNKLQLPGGDAFSELEADFLVQADRTEFAALRIHHDGVRLDLDGLLLGLGQQLAGQVKLGGSELGLPVQEIGGTLGAPEFSPSRIALPE